MAFDPYKELEKLLTAGFDDSEVDDEEDLLVGCSQCISQVINNVACHEHGCSNMGGI